MRKNVTPGETPAKITVSMIDQDLKDGVSKSDMAVKYGIKPWEVDEMFKHPFLKGRRPSRKKALSFIFEDDTLPLNSGDIAVEQVEEVDPNQVTLHDAIDEAIESATQAQEALTEAVEAVEEIFPTEVTGVPNGDTMSDTDDDEDELGVCEVTGATEYDGEELDTDDVVLPSFEDTLNEVADQLKEEDLDMDDDSFEM